MPGLRDILDSATLGPWTWMGGYPQRITNPGAILVAETFTDPDSRAYNAELIALAPELAAEVLELRERHREAMALALDMGEALTEIRQNGRPDFGDCGAATCEHPGCLYTRKYDALLARLDQLGKEQTEEYGPHEVGQHGSYWAIFTPDRCVISLHETRTQAEAWLECLRANGFVRPAVPPVGGGAK